MAGASGVRYRYKGKIVSRADAARIGNLPAAKRYLQTEYTYKSKTESRRSGYSKPVETLVKEALKADRKAAEQKRQQAAPSKWQAAKERSERAAWKKEQARARAAAVEAAELAEDEDISIEDAFDRLDYGPDDFDTLGMDEVIGMAREYVDEGDGFFDFEMTDLESESNYG